jgi:hypothetical protein
MAFLAYTLGMKFRQTARLFDWMVAVELPPVVPRRYSGVLTVVENGKGCLDIDTVKGCTRGMAAYPIGGCYGECYAAKAAARYGIDFTVSVSRRIHGREHRGTLIRMMNDIPVSWYRVGTAGDPCHDWSGTLSTLRALRHTKKTPVIVTKHWLALDNEQIDALRELGAVVNTSISALDTEAELRHRLQQRDRLRDGGVTSVCRVVTCDFTSPELREKQAYLLSLAPIIDNPLRATKAHRLAQSGQITLTRRNGSIGGGKLVSLHNPSIYIGQCANCPDQCGVPGGEQITMTQKQLFSRKVEFQYVKSVIGSGYEQAVATLALEDGIAHRAARKNMQIHSAIILLIDEAFAGFMTFQVNDEVREFCLLQSVIKPELHTTELYCSMVQQVIDRANASGYPCFMTTDPKSKFETPKLFESLGFETYLKMGEFHYMCRGTAADSRLKLLAHITMTNVWDSTRGMWLTLKKDWREKIEATGKARDIPNPMFASRDGCWQGTNGFANVVTGHAHNGNASVLDSVACEVVLRFFMPRDGRRIYNPFGGGVQFGYVAGSYGYEYLASEIRKNQCDANNLLCSDFTGVTWEQSDSSTYEPEGMFDLIFTCPPYYKVEKYLDYDGKPPAGEINSLATYDEFRDTLFAGYARAIAHLNDGCFFVVMTGDSRDGKGAYHCSEAETELFLRGQGLSIYNRIVYLEGEFTRLAQAKVTLNTRKFPKREQKIIVAYKGSTSEITDRYAKIGRL